MREGIDIEVSVADRERLAAVVGDRNSRQKHVWRAQIILATAEGCGTAEIMRRAGVRSPVCGAGKNASCRLVTTACCAIRPDPRASRHLGRISLSVS